MNDVIVSFLQLMNPSQNLGGYKRAAIYRSSEIVQQTFQTQSILAPPLLHIRSIKPIVAFEPKKFDSNVSILNSRTNTGRNTKVSFTLIFDAQGQEHLFLPFFERQLNGRCCVEITTMNDITFIFNPFWANLEYLPANTVNDTARFQLTFERAAFVNYAKDKISVIKNITTRTLNYAAVPGNEVTINLFPFCSAELFQFGYSPTNDLTTIIFQNIPENNILSNLADGIYYFFAVNQHAKAFDCVRATITQGEVQIDPDFNNSTKYLTNENTTVEDEGEIII